MDDDSEYQEFMREQESDLTEYVRAIAQLDKTVQLRAVTTCDNQGEPCEYCQLLGRDIEATLYGNQEGHAGSVGCCIPCIPAVAASEFDAEVTVVAEIAA